MSLVLNVVLIRPDEAISKFFFGHLENPSGVTAYYKTFNVCLITCQAILGCNCNCNLPLLHFSRRPLAARRGVCTDC